ncbi:MAG: hypothetical protein JRK53_29135 [Deltaproteobacteria bacterium]|nr:hypothetical protein [Deltaproteobacteria bacterium]
MIVAGWASIAAAEEGGLGGSGPPAPIIRTGGIGKIQRIQGDDIVIDDRLYTLKSDTQYMTSGGESTLRGGFQAPDPVIFEIDSGGEIRLLRKMK